MLLKDYNSLLKLSKIKEIKGRSISAEINGEKYEIGSSAQLNKNNSIN